MLEAHTAIKYKEIH